MYFKKNNKEEVKMDLPTYLAYITIVYKILYNPYNTKFNSRELNRFIIENVMSRFLKDKK